nr:MAG TPA: hypothetical protein [Caudoviricetes sp.]
MCPIIRGVSNYLIGTNVRKNNYPSLYIDEF